MVTKLSEIPTLFQKYGVYKKVLDKISLWTGDITQLEVDAIVNAANARLQGGGGVDGAIHRAAGYKELQEECRKIGYCDTGEAVITSGCNIPHIKNIIHAVGPMVRADEPTDEEEHLLRSCYKRSIERAIENDLRSIAFCCISTGIYGYPHDEAAYAVGNTLCNFLKKSRYADHIDRIVLITFLPVDKEYYDEFFDKFAEKYVDQKEETAEVEEDKKSEDNEDKKAEAKEEEKSEVEEDEKVEDKEEEKAKEEEKT